MPALSRYGFIGLVIVLGIASRSPRLLLAQAPNAKAWAQQGIEAAQRRDWQRAVAAFTEALRLDPNYTVARYNRCVARFKLDETHKALEDCTEALRLNPKYAEAYYIRGLMRSERLGDNQAAVSDFDQAVRLKPDYAAAYLKRGNARYRLGDHQGGLSDYSQAIRLAPDDADAYFNRAVARANQGEKQGALEDLQAAAKHYQNQGDKAGYQRATDALQKVTGK